MRRGLTYRGSLTHHQAKDVLPSIPMCMLPKFQNFLHDNVLHLDMIPHQGQNLGYKVPSDVWAGPCFEVLP